MGKSESQMGIVEKSTRSRKKPWSVLELGLAVLLLLMTCSSVTLVILYMEVKGKPVLFFPISFYIPREEKTLVRRDFKDPRIATSFEEICVHPGCVIAASRIIQNMDPTSEPCNDFYQYACGGWLNRHVIPESSSRYSIFDKLRDDLEIILKGVLETPREGDRNAIQKAKMLYSSCMNENLIESRDSQPLLKILEIVGDWPVATDNWKEVREPYWVMEEKLSMMNSQFNKRLLIDMFVWNDDRDSRSHIIYIDQPSLGMPSKDYYFNSGNYQRVREAYLQFMISIAKMIRADLNFTKDDEFVENEMLLVMKFETEIANATLAQEERHDVTLLYHRMNISQLQSTFSFKVSTPFSQNFNWTVFIQIVMSSVNINILENEEVVVYGVPYLQNLQEIISKYPARTIQNYLVWRLVQDQISNLSHRFKEARVSYRKALYGTSLEDVQWRECVRYVNNNMESAVGALYVKQSFAGESKRMVSDLIQKVREVFIETLNELQWMDELSKKRAQEKATAIREQIGYPDYILEEQNKKLDDEYYQLNFKEDMFFENTLENLKSNAQKSLKKLREKVDQDVWIIGAAVVNAFYSPNRNQIVFPAGILQPPFFSKQQLQALNFGGIGMVIGHEITHGFDDNGRNFDKDGNMLDWWSNFSSQHFKEQTKCMVYQYSNYSWDLAGGQHVSGLGTLGENIADNGGIRQAYKAYIKWVEQEGQEPRLPGLNLTHEQLFFINFAQVWCGSYRPEYASQSIKTDVHSPLKYRVMGSLQNFEAFSEAFHCHTGTVMHPEEKCRVW
ncbi:membrane metallo-endopeptidase-like 1 [Vombatus ursinus]|uniref:membrane metallo-endopeptidase-like 1 n=1 Tax=Vombatus ursinus TaxID=29139 RepID=UPI000FFCE983|nr:membrane metallo-endopeptidase-like 1 [Vombatus ursinus]XP_027699787.1 membrane metallo-endopeptidase-like 1 [Vombatus ursinus]